MKREFARCFGQVEFVERKFLPYSNRPRALAKVPFGPALYGFLGSRFLYGVRAAMPAPAPRAAHLSSMLRTS